MGAFGGIAGINDDDQDQDLLGVPRRLGPPNFAGIAGPSMRPAVNLPGIDVPKKSPSSPGSPTTPSTNSTNSKTSTNSNNSANRVSMASPELDRHTQELSRLETTGSGVSQIHNPFLRGLARVGDIAGSALFPRITAEIPGTTLHHRQLMADQSSEIAQLQGQELKNAQTAETQARADKAEADAQPVAATPEQQAYDDLIKQGKSPFEAYQSLKTVAQKPVNPGSAEAQAYEALIKQGVQPFEAFKQIQGAKQEVKPDTGTQEDQRYERIVADEKMGKAVSAEDQAFKFAYEKRKNLGAVTKFNLEAPGKESARTDKSYQLNSAKLDKLGEPIQQSVARLGRLQETLKQATPQADALVAPELLTIMAGGMGSGLRMNEAEISRVVGGRSHWENLKASAQHWSTDPTTANSITAEQRREIHMLVDAVQAKLLAKQKVLDQANDELLNSDDVAEHRRIVAEAKQELTAIDEGIELGGGGGGEMIRVQIPGHPPGRIPAGAKAQFLKDHPGAQVLR